MNNIKFLDKLLSSTLNNKQSLSFTLGLVLGLSCLPVVAGYTVPQTPLQSGTAVAPNIMVILDDSGSMVRDIIPESFVYDNLPTTEANYVFPTLAAIYGTGMPHTVAEVDDVTTTADDTLGFTAIVRSPQQNKLYYNPAVTYKPWATATGTPMANAPPVCALHNPLVTGTGTVNCRNLTVDNTTQGNAIYVRCFNTNTPNPGGCTASADTATRTFWPALYYRHNGGDIWNRANYTTVNIVSTTTSYTGDGRALRTDCPNIANTPYRGNCTYAEEIQNFANWYTYYRSRNLTAKAGIGQSFADLPPDNASTPAPRVGFGALNNGSATIDGVISANTIVNGLRTFDPAGRTTFFTNLYARSPNGGTPLRRALDGAGVYYERADNNGPWSATPGTSSTVAQLSCRQSYTILTTDGYWNGSAAATAAATANNDGTAGSLILSPGGAPYTYAPVNPFTDARANTLADVAMYYWKRDLRPDIVNRVPPSPKNNAYWQHMVTIGVGIGVTGDIDPATAFAAIPTNTAIAWADPAPVTSENAKIDDLLHAAVNGRGSFFTANDPVALKDGLAAVLNSINDDVSSASSVATNSTSLDAGTRIFQATYAPQKWSGELRSFAVTGAGAANTSEWSASTLIPSPGSRNILTINGTAGVPFTWAAIPTAKQTQLGNANVLNYLRGDRSLEGSAPSNYRQRASALGDIINSSPVFVKPINPPLPAAQLPGVVYVGANDGMLHGFRADTGVEILAYVPGILDWTGLATLSSKLYSHRFFTDGQIVVSEEAQTPGQRILVGALGRGGKGVYALDVTKPFGVPLTPLGPNVKWESIGGPNAADMGQVLNVPVIAKLNSGDTVALVSNGINSTNDDAVLFVINLDTGAVIEAISTGNTTNNGLSGLRTLDSDKDGDVDFVFAGDYNGNVWRFNLTANSSGAWAATKLFTATDAGGLAQPITGSVILGRDASFNLWVFFGTGSYLTSGDPANTNVQTWYGLMNGATTITGRSQLKQRKIAVTTVTAGGVPVRAFEKAVSGDMAGMRGWYIDLVEPPTPPGTALGERMIGQPRLVSDSVLIALSITPKLDVCESGGDSFLNAIDPYTGGNVTSSFFDANGDGVFNDTVTDADGNVLNVGSYGLDIGIASGFIINSNQILVGGSAQSGIGINPEASSTQAVDSSGNPRTGRVSWREILNN